VTTEERNDGEGARAKHEQLRDELASLDRHGCVGR